MTPRRRLNDRARRALIARRREQAVPLVDAEVDDPMTVPRFFALCAVGAVMWAALVFGLWSFLP